MTRTWMGVLLALFTSASAWAEGPVHTRRFALIVGVNDGGVKRSVLRYAVTDAQAFARVMEEMGGVAPEDLQLLTEPSRGDLVLALGQLGGAMARARNPQVHLELVLYYSGHSDAGGLLLKGERLGYPELRSALANLPADVRIAILDSCASGAVTRKKGGAQLPPFLYDASAQVHGHAFLTSSSEDEAAQESDTLGGSFFTHALVSGLRGAADLSQDGKVTLNEAYQFAFSETLQGTEGTQAGAQHAAYDMELAGTGDVVVTDLRSATATLEFPAALEGRVFVRDAQQRLALELYKSAGRRVQVGLAAESYSRFLSRGREAFRGQVTLHTGQTSVVEAGSLVAAPLELTARRGGPEPVSISSLASVPGHHHRVSAEILSLFIPKVALFRMEYEQALGPRWSGFVLPEFQAIDRTTDGVFTRSGTLAVGVRFYLFTKAIQGAYADAHAGPTLVSPDGEASRYGATVGLTAGYTFVVQKVLDLSLGLGANYQALFGRKATGVLQPVFRVHLGFGFL